MMTRRLAAQLSYIVLLMPIFAWAINESGVPADTQPDIAAPATVQPTTTAAPLEATFPPKNTALPPAVSAKPVATPLIPAKSAPAPVKPVAAPLIPAKSAPVPVKPVAAPLIPAKSAPVPAQPVVAPLIPAKSAPVPVKPVAAPLIPAKSAPVPAKPVLVKPVPVPSKPPLAPTTAINPAKPSSPPTIPPPVPLKNPVTPALPPVTEQTNPASSPTPHELPLDSAAETIDIEAFIRDGCQQCERAKEFLARLKKLQPQLNIIIRDVRKEPAALALVKRMAERQPDVTLDYPAFVVGGQLIIGFSEKEHSAQLILDTFATSHPSSDPILNCETGKEPSCSLITLTPVAKIQNLTLQILGYSVPLFQIGMPLFTFMMGLLDGLNHGSTWVLMLLLSLYSPLKDRPLMLAIAGTFIATQAVSYFVLMAVWFNFFQLIDTGRILQISMTASALVAAAFYLKKYIYFGRSISLTSQEISKPGIYTRIRKIIQTESLVGALSSTVLLALLVQLGEFSYTSVFPVFYTHVLSLQNLGSLSNYAYLLLYNVAYMLDAVIMMMIGITTLSEHRPQTEKGRMLKLVSSALLFGIGVYTFLGKH